jgi:hypothetical protein
VLALAERCRERESASEEKIREREKERIYYPKTPAP